MKCFTNFLFVNLFYVFNTSNLSIWFIKLNFFFMLYILWRIVPIILPPIIFSDDILLISSFHWYRLLHNLHILSCRFLFYFLCSIIFNILKFHFAFLCFYIHSIFWKIYILFSVFYATYVVSFPLSFLFILCTKLLISDNCCKISNKGWMTGRKRRDWGKEEGHSR